MKRSGSAATAEPSLRLVRLTFGANRTGLFVLFAIAHLSHEIVEDLVDVGSHFGACLDVPNLPLIRQLLRLFSTHFALGVQIRFVADQNDRNVRFVALDSQDLFAELLNRSKTFAFRDRKHANEAVAGPEVIVSNRRVIFLSGRVCRVVSGSVALD
jgi:hypothetical protein